MNPRTRLFPLVSKLYTAVFFLLPILFFPIPAIPLASHKTIFLGLVALVSALVYVYVAWKERTYLIGSTYEYWTIVVAGVGLALSAFLSENVSMSLFGRAFEVGTLVSIVFPMYLFYYALILLRDDMTRINAWVRGLVIGAVIGLVWFVARLVGLSEILSFGLFSGVSANLFGTLGDFISLNTVVLLIVLFTLTTTSLSTNLRRGLTVLAVFFAATLLYLGGNLSGMLEWIFISLFFVVLLGKRIVEEKKKSESFAVVFKKRPIVVLTVITVLSFVVLVFGNNVRDYIYIKTGVAPIENTFSPSFATTLNIAKESLKGNWLFGTGLQTFTYEWSKFKPVSINYESYGNLDFKNIDLGYGPGLLPTLVITSGLIGVLLLMVLILSTIWLAIKGYRLVDSESRVPFLLASYTSLYVWAVFVLLIPNPGLLLILFVAEAYKLTLYFKARGSGYRDVTIGEGSRGILVFAGVALPALALIILVVGVLKNTGAFVFVTRAQEAFTQNRDAESADASLRRALALNNSDLYHVLRADLALAQANVLLQSTTTNEKERAIRVKELVDTALTASQKALERDSLNYQNYVAQARVYEARLSLGDAQAYQNAQSAYAAARTYNPLNPDIPLYQAQLARAVGDATSTDRFVAEALQRKQDYLNVAFFYAQNLVERKQLSNAIQFLSQYGDYYYTNFGSSTPLRRESLSVIAHNLGLLHYEAKNYDLAVQSFSLALQYTPSYQDAALMLMLAEARTGDRAEAIRIGKILLEANPANENLRTTVTTLEKGGNIFSGEVGARTEEVTKNAKEIREDENQKKVPETNVKTTPKR